MVPSPNSRQKDGAGFIQRLCLCSNARTAVRSSYQRSVAFTSPTAGILLRLRHALPRKAMQAAPSFTMTAPPPPAVKSEYRRVVRC